MSVVWTNDVRLYKGSDGTTIAVHAPRGFCESDEMELDVWAQSESSTSPILMGCWKPGEYEGVSVVDSVHGQTKQAFVYFMSDEHLSNGMVEMWIALESLRYDGKRFVYVGEIPYAHWRAKQARARL